MIENGCGIISVPADLHKDFFIKLTEYRETNDSENISEFIYNECITGVKMIWDIEWPGLTVKNKILY